MKTVKPILFSAPMIRAILEGRKTQTRRIIKPQAEDDEKIDKCHWAGTEWSTWYKNGGCQCRPVKCPYGQTGGALWVRETCQIYGFWTPNGRTKTGKPSIKFNTHYDRKVKYDGDFEKEGAKNPLDSWHKKPSIHMPKWASRITLEIKDIRVERLRPISEQDAIAEGCVSTAIENKAGDDYSGAYSSENFAELWESINGPDSWNANPWVWVVEFEAHQCNIDDYLNEYLQKENQNG